MKTKWTTPQKQEFVRKQRSQPVLMQDVPDGAELPTPRQRTPAPRASWHASRGEVPARWTLSTRVDFAASARAWCVTGGGGGGPTRGTPATDRSARRHGGPHPPWEILVVWPHFVRILGYSIGVIRISAKDVEIFLWWVPCCDGWPTHRRFPDRKVDLICTC